MCRPGLVLAPRPHRPLVAAMEQEAMQDLFSWLLDGAMQRAPPGGTVSVSAEAVDGGVAITITDTGRPSFLVQAHRLDQCWLSMARPCLCRDCRCWSSHRRP